MQDGVIKYQFNCLSKESPNHDEVKKIEYLRKILHIRGLIGEKEGVGYGNISQRNQGNSFIITGTQTGHLTDLKPEHYSKVQSLDYQKFSISYSGLIRPSSEAMTHGSIYDLDSQIGAVIHIHSYHLWSFMLRNNYLKTEDVTYGSIEMITEIKRVYKDIDPLKNPTLVMSGHKEGILIFGRDLEKAEMNFWKLLHEER